MSEAAIVARGLGKRFGPWTALHPLDLDVPRGALLAVLGPNGSGKTTLLRLLAGLARPSHGTLELGTAGEDRRARRRRIGLVTHATLLYPALTARENLVLAGRLFGLEDPGARADALLERLELSAAAQRRTGAFSRGMAQRLSIARALLHAPEVLLLDEPFTGLDARAADIVEALLRALTEEGRTLVVADHDLARAARLATHGLLLRAGRASEVEPDVVHDPARLTAHYREATEDSRP